MTGNLTASQRQIRMAPPVADTSRASRDSCAGTKWGAAVRASVAIVFVILAALGAGFATAVAGTPPETAVASSRGFVFSYAVKVKIPPNSHTVHARIPLPATDEFQTISDLRLQAPAGVQIREDSGVGPRYADFSADRSRVKGPFEVHVTFTVVRFERRVNLTAVQQAGVHQAGLPGTVYTDDLTPFLQADRWSPIDESVQMTGQQQTEGLTDPLQKARKLFDYVISTAAGPAQQRTSAHKPCDSRGAGCTGFNSLFVSLARSQGIPARLEIGFSFPDGEKEGAISGYHSWAEFFVNGIGWIPLDASQAAADPDRRDDFFGSIDARRVMIAGGRDSQSGQLMGQMTIPPPATLSAEPLNDLVDPQVEIDGKPFKYSADFLFQEADIAGPTSSRRPVFAQRQQPAPVFAGG